MTKYGFVIDQRKCIGCHACTLACKSENLVPVGSFRTWVKYIEKGEFPNTRRYFSIQRCQHCEDAPCVEICPTKALYKRDDGIVDFSSDRCIGCKSCMQACPYDALYIDPSTNTAAKCHYCAHRTDRGLLPACAVVCPVNAIIAGDLEDATSEIAQTLGREQVQVRRPDQGTRPQVFYVGADETTITPGLATQPPAYMWSQLGPSGLDLEPKGFLLQVADGAPTPASQSSSIARAVTVYDVAHPKPWGWRVSTYLLTKSIAGGALAVAGPLIALGLAGADSRFATAAALVAIVFTLLTAALLVWDLKRPDRFWRVILTPNLRSWLPWGAYILMAYGVLAGLWFLGSVGGLTSWLGPLVWPCVLLGLAAAGYSAFLFGQAEGRDFWQSPLLLWQLLGAAAVAGSGGLLLLALLLGLGDASLPGVLGGALLLSLLATFAIVLVELYSIHANKDVATAAAFIKHGAMAREFWVGYVLIGVALPVLILAGVAGLGLPSALGGLAALLGLIGLWCYEDAWVRAGQSVAIS